jgi:hypothetical protein
MKKSENNKISAMNGPYQYELYESCGRHTQIFFIFIMRSGSTEYFNINVKINTCYSLLICIYWIIYQLFC